LSRTNNIKSKEISNGDKILTVDNLINWLEDQLNKRGWRPADLARTANIPDATLSNILNQNRKAGPDVCNAIAKALNEPPEKIFRLAGLLPYLPPAVEEEREAIVIFRSLPADIRAIVLQMLRSFKTSVNPSVADPTITYQAQEATYEIPSLETEITQFLIEFPELEIIIEEAKRRQLSEPALRALMTNVRIFAHNELERANFSQLHQLLSDTFSRLVA
jgi:transcriptional regulator with XRE-family HTH domain